MEEPTRTDPNRVRTRRRADEGTAADTDTDLDHLHDVFTRVQPKLWRAVLGWSGSSEIADDAVAEAFVQLARRGDAVNDPDAWVWRSAFRIAAGQLATRRARWQSEGISIDERWDVGALDVGVSNVDSVLDLLAALAELSDQQRHAIILVDAAGFKAPEAARLMRTTAGTVRIQLMRARRRLRARLGNTTDTNGEEQS